jgi:hypothetical protein
VGESGSSSHTYCVGNASPPAAEDDTTITLNVSRRDRFRSSSVSTPDGEASASQSADAPVVGTSAIVASPLRSKYTHAPIDSARSLMAFSRSFSQVSAPTTTCDVADAATGSSEPSAPWMS